MKLMLAVVPIVLFSAACAPRYAAPEPPAAPPLVIQEFEPEIFEPIPEPEIPGIEVVEELHGALAGVNLATFEMPVHVNDHVLAYIDLFTGRARGRFEQWLQRQGVYADIIDARLTEKGLPRELSYLALIESGYSPVAVSHANAVGLWQFIASTGRLEGLEISEFVDERRDPVRATDAAIQHLGKLYDRFGSWYLAAAAYNAGSGRIERALASGAGGRRGNDSIFWEIRHLLPAETRNYVPQLIAASIVGTYRHRFGFDVHPHAALAFDVAVVPDATELAVIAEAAGVERAAITALNPQFTRGMTPPGRSVDVRLPAGTGDAFRVAYAAIPADQRVRTHVHIVAAGETLSHIARRYGTSVAAIQAANRIDRPDRIGVGRRLVVPTAASAALAAASQPQRTASAPQRSAANASASAGPAESAESAEPAGLAAPVTSQAAATGAAQSYTVRSGDTLSAIARRHGITLAQLTQLNGIQANSTIRPGQSLRVRPLTMHRVQSGDTLTSIARRYGVSIGDLRQWNGLASDLIRPGDRLEVRL